MNETKPYRYFFKFGLNRQLIYALKEIQLNNELSDSEMIALLDGTLKSYIFRKSFGLEEDEK